MYIVVDVDYIVAVAGYIAPPVVYLVVCQERNIAVGMFLLAARSAVVVGEASVKYPDATVDAERLVLMPQQILVHWQIFGE